MQCKSFFKQIQGTHKRMVRFQKLTRNLFLTLHGHNVHHQQQQLSKFLMCSSSLLLMLTAGTQGQFPRWRHSRKRLCVCSVLRCPDLWLQRSVSFVHGLEKTHHAWSAWETWTVAAADGVCCARVRWEISFLLTFETTPFFCVYPVQFGKAG